MERPNIVLKDTCQSEPYTSSSNYVPKSQINRDRPTHSKKLLGQLNTAFKENLERKVHAVSARGGTYLEFKGNDTELVTKSLENVRQGVRLLNVRQTDEATYATVFIPSGRENFFLKRIEDYGNETLAKENDRTPNETLVSSIQDIRLAMVDSLWTGRGDMRPAAKRQWVEIWLRTGKDEDGSAFTGYSKILDMLGIKHKGEMILFPERMVTLAFANKDDLVSLLDSYEYLAEFREATIAASFFSNLEPKEQSTWIDDLLRRTTFDLSNVRVCMIDTGVNSGNPLLEPLVDPDVILTTDEAIGTADRDNHGTKIAGLAAYDDLKEFLASDQPVTVTHGIESVKIYDSRHPNEDPDLYGDLERQAIDHAYIVKPDRRRIFCSAVTAEQHETTNGLPTSWSAAIDETIAHADDPSEEHELFLISGGNIPFDLLEGTTYPDANESRPVLTPGQAWNALTVGAYSENVLIEEEDVKATGYQPVARIGELCPFSRTSLPWNQSQAPVKPEVVFPGGNAIGKDGGYSDCQDLSLLTTGANVVSRPLDTINATSAAVGKAAYMAVELENAYPELWPETIRGLIVHSARWSQAMFDRCCPTGSKDDTMTKGRHRMLHTCGYGIPDLDRAIECRENSVNLIIQGTIKPYKVTDGYDTMNEMHLHTLPWPKETLEALGDKDATLHVTLSYYIEPGPGEIGWKDKYRYASHGLRFDVNLPGETRDKFEHRINVSVREEDEGKTASDSGGWYLGVNNRNKGSIHSDYKFSSGADLAEIEYVAVYPVIGWWRSRRYLGKIDSLARYSLIVSIEMPAEDARLYTAITQKIASASGAGEAVAPIA